MDFVKSHEDFIVQFLNHLGTSAMMDLLLQMVAAPENDKTRIELAEVRCFLAPLSFKTLYRACPLALVIRLPP